MLKVVLHLKSSAAGNTAHLQTSGDFLYFRGFLIALKRNPDFELLSLEDMVHSHACPRQQRK